MSPRDDFRGRYTDPMGGLQQQPMPEATPSARKVARGRRQVLELDGGGALDMNKTYPLIELAGPERIYAVTFAPLTTVGTGMFAPPPAPLVAALARYTMLWGAGGVTFQFRDIWPHAGATITVAADSLTIFGAAGSATALAADQRPVIAAWTVPCDAVATAPYIFTAGAQNSAVAVTAPAFARAVNITNASAGFASMTIDIVAATGAVVQQLRTTAQQVRLPLPSWAREVVVTTSDASQWWSTFELLFS
jgi:hypothetical protein